MPAFSVSPPRSSRSQATNPPRQRLVRFLAKDGKTYYGDAIMPSGVTDIAKITQARVIRGDIFGKHDVTDQVAVSGPRVYGR